MSLKWVKHGKIFDPTDYSASEPYIGLFAQSPQTLVFENFIRIYFSTRRVEETSGKFISHVSYVDMDKKLQKIIGFNKSSVISRGSLGCFDEHGIFPFNVVRHQNKILAYTTGWSRRVSVSVDTGIGLALSEDEGKSFQRYGTGPVMSASVGEPYLVADAFVKSINNQLHMWYIFGTKWMRYKPDCDPDRTYKIGYATSTNGIDWKRTDALQIIPDLLGEYESQALPSVAYWGGIYHMFFCYRESYNFRKAAGRGYRLGYARSKDLIEWERDDSQVSSLESEAGWDGEMQCYPHIFECDGTVFLLYNGNEFGRYGFGVAELVLK